MSLVTYSFGQLAQFFNSFVLSLLSILPSSPFNTLVQFSCEYQLLGVLNYFIPFDICSEFLLTWLSCIAAYYIYLFVNGTISSKNTILKRIINFLF